MYERASCEQMFQGCEKTKINLVKHCLVELKEFQQKKGEPIELYYDRLNELIYKCSHNGITKTSHHHYGFNKRMVKC